MPKNQKTKVSQFTPENWPKTQEEAGSSSNHHLFRSELLNFRGCHRHLPWMKASSNWCHENMPSKPTFPSFLKLSKPFNPPPPSEKTTEPHTSNFCGYGQLCLQVRRTCWKIQPWPSWSWLGPPWPAQEPQDVGGFWKRRQKSAVKHDVPFTQKLKTAEFPHVHSKIETKAEFFKLGVPLKFFGVFRQ